MKFENFKRLAGRNERTHMLQTHKHKPTFFLKLFIPINAHLPPINVHIPIIYMYNSEPIEFITAQCPLFCKKKSGIDTLLYRVTASSFHVISSNKNKTKTIYFYFFENTMHSGF